MQGHTRPLLIYDGDCGFCRRWIERWRTATGDRVDYAASQEVAGRFPEIPAERFAESVVLVDGDGAVYYGAEAALRALAYTPSDGKLWWAYRRVPGFARMSEAMYRVAASHRYFSSAVTRMLWGDEVRPPRYELVRWTLLRGLGLIYFTAYVSLWLQIDGLIGSRGILPAAPWLDAVARNYGEILWMRLPTLFWFGASDGALHAVSAVGTVASLLLVFNTVPFAASIVAWVCYLSLYTVGRTFLSFQWDILLLETGVLAILLAPWQLRPGVVAWRAASAPVIWLWRLLLFKLMFLSGAVKLLSRDVAWWNLSALIYHYETQPLPAWTSWYMHQLPLWFHQFCCAAMFAIELGVPFLIFLPRRPRMVACMIEILMQLVIIATGNYCFFNLLTVLLCVSLLDDRYLATVFPARLKAEAAAAPRGRPRPLVGRLVLGALVAGIFVMSSAQVVGRLWSYSIVPAQIRSALDATRSLHVTSSYGLFAVMTKNRPEIVIEGSEDGEAWKPYEFKWKPGDVRRRPMFVAPHQPRVDWQMWFAALGNYRRNPWLMSLMERLLEGSEPVLGLLATNPFPDEPPRHMRAVIYDYHFTDSTARDGEGAWWRRDNPRPYAPTLHR